jgi:hypothetical protein
VLFVSPEPTTPRPPAAAIARYPIGTSFRALPRAHPLLLPPSARKFSTQNPAFALLPLPLVTPTKQDAHTTSRTTLSPFFFPLSLTRARPLCLKMRSLTGAAMVMAAVLLCATAAASGEFLGVWRPKKERERWAGLFFAVTGDGLDAPRRRRRPLSLLGRKKTHSSPPNKKTPQPPPPRPPRQLPRPQTLAAAPRPTQTPSPNPSPRRSPPNPTCRPLPRCSTLWGSPMN